MTIVVKNNVKKLSVGQKITNKFECCVKKIQRFKGQECGFQKRAGVSVQVSVNREQGRKQMSDKVLYHPVFTIRLLVPDTCNLMCTKTKN